MITLHHLENSRSQRILWLLEELGLEYEIKLYKRNVKTSLAPPELMKVHPLGKSPVITDGELTIAESGAIVEYLIFHYGTDKWRFEPGTQQWMDYNYWMHYAEGSVMPMLVMTLIFNQIKRAPMPFFVRPIARGISDKVMKGFIQPNVINHLGFIEKSLKGKQWFVDDRLSGADIQMIFPIEAAAARANFADKYPSILSYMERVHARPAYQRALEKGGPYQLMS